MKSTTDKVNYKTSHYLVSYHEVGYHQIINFVCQNKSEDIFPQEFYVLSECINFSQIHL